ncbi:MAG: VanW family protein [Patescibacteria group bacterium]
MIKKFIRKFRRKKKQRELRKIIPFLAVFGILLLVESAYFTARNELSHRLPFGIRIANAEFSLVTAEDAIAELEILAGNFLARPLTFEANGETVEIMPAEIELEFDVERKIGLLKSELVNFGSVELPVNLDEKQLRKLLLAKLPQLEYSATNAKVFLNTDGELEILAEKSGQKTDFAEIAAAVKKRAGIFSNEAIEIKSEEILPKVFAEKLEPFREELAKIIREKLVLKKTAYERFEINLAERIAWFDFRENGEIKVFLRRDSIDKFVEKELNPLLAELPRDVSISQNFAGRIEFEGVAKSGRTVDAEELFTRISAAIESGNSEVEIPLRILAAPVKATDELRDLGIRELVGEAITTYEGSPANRQHNIRIAADKLSGIFIPPGEEFSFVGSLGAVTTSTGYLRELIIKEGDVVPEIGGGVCQVSTTFFRTALATGLPITRQKPHSLKVHYYFPPGLDATVYPGSADLKFLNDTGHHLLVQAEVEETKLRVNFFGTNDGRSVKLTGPFYPNGDPITDLWLAGMKMFWTRKIIPAEGNEIVEKYSAAYRLMPAH